MKYLARAAVVMTLVGLASPALAEGPEGTWTWAFNNQRDNVLRYRLNSEGPTLLGVYLDGQTNRETELPPTVFRHQDGKISFSVFRDVGGQKSEVKYSGVLRGDTITGTCEFDVRGQVQSIKWVAKRRAHAEP